MAKRFIRPAICITSTRVTHNAAKKLPSKVSKVDEMTAAEISPSKTKTYQKPKYDRVHLAKIEIADSISKMLINSPNVKDSLCFEINPGPGFLTEALLRDGIARLRLLECDPEFLPGLESIRAKNLDKVEVVNVDFFKFARLSYLDTITSTKNALLLLRGVQVKSWTESTPIVIFAAVPQKYEGKFMRYILISLARQSDLFSCGRVQLMFFVSGKEFDIITAVPKSDRLYKMVHILYNVFFDIEFLTKESKKSFHLTKTSNPANLKHDNNHMYLIRLTPKIDLFSNFSSPEQLLEFYCFVKQHSVRRTAYVINSLERWIPNCGPRFIKEDFTIHNRFGDLSPKQYLKVFQLFSTCPGYLDCQFRTVLQKLNLRDVNQDSGSASSSDDEDAN